MGFFFPEEAKGAKAPAQPRTKAPRAAPAAGRVAKAGCDACSRKALWPGLASPRMRADNRNGHDAEILIIGGAPSMEGDRIGHAMTGPDWEYAKKAMGAYILDRAIFQPAVRCAHPQEADPAIADVRACATYVADDLEGLPIRIVLAFGQEALAQFHPGVLLSDVRGIPIPTRLGKRVVWLYPVFDPRYVLRMKGKWDDGPMAPILQSDLRRLRQEAPSWGKPRIAQMDPAEVLLPESEEEARAYLDALNDVPLGFDIETNQLSAIQHGARVLTAAFSDGEISVAFPVDHPEASPAWAYPLMFETLRKRRWVAHNAEFELNWTRQKAREQGVSDSFAPFDDSMALVRLYYERETVNALETASLVRLGVDLKALTGINASRINSYKLSEILPYNGLDAQGSALIQQGMAKAVGTQRLREDSYDRALRSIKATSQMRLLGLKIDFTASEELRDKWSAVEKAARAKLPKIYEIKAFEAARGIEFDVDKPEHVGEALVEFGKASLPRTPKGKQYKTDDEALSKLESPLARAVLDIREARKMVSTYIDCMLEARELYPDQRLHPGYTTLMTKTLRLSSQDPNIQNFPSRKHRELRRQIIADPGHVLLAVDYGQIEARLLGMASRDRRLCESTIAARDIHTDWLNHALKVYPDYMDRLALMSGKTTEKEILKAGRTVIKTDLVFAAFYGSGVNAISTRTSIPEKETKEILDAFWREFAGVKAWIKKQRALYRDTGRVLTLTGRARNNVLSGNEPINTPIQGTAADVMVDAMNELAELAELENDAYLHPRISIHDDLTFILPDDDRLPVYAERIMQTMVKLRYPWQIVPFAAEGKVGDSWESLEEFATVVGDYHS